MDHDQVSSLVTFIGWVVLALGVLLTLTSIDNASGLGFTGYLAATTGGLAVSGIGAITLALGRILSILTTASVLNTKKATF